MTEVSLTALQQYADRMLIAIQNFDSSAHMLFDTMRRTGCRFEDVYTASRWTPAPSGGFNVQTAKHSAIRTIPRADVNPDHAQLIDVSCARPFPYSYAQYLRYFSRFFPEPDLYVKSKPVRTHIFRHIRAKELHHAGHSDTTVQAYLGEKQLSSAQQYIYSVVHLK